jgi:hypothetical protein
MSAFGLGPLNTPSTFREFPYFESFLKFNQASGQISTQLPTHSQIPFFDIINDGMQNHFSGCYMC